MTTALPYSPRNIAGLPLSPACRDGMYDACTGFSGGYDTYLCGHRRHWCPNGEHLVEQCPDFPAPAPFVPHTPKEG